MKQVLLLMTNRHDLYTIDKIESLMSVINNYTEFYILYNATSNILPTALEPYKDHIFSFTSDILYTMGYQPLGDSLVYGNCHFPVLKFFLAHQEYDYYWTIEDDVVFTGNWSTLIDHYKKDTSDFISALIRTYDDEPQWNWWNSLYTNSESIDKESIIAAFNPIYRMSNRALSLVNQTLLRGWRGHAEVIISTIMRYNSLSIKDMGGSGRYVPKGEEDLFYTTESHSYKALKTQSYHPNFIYHPIKQKISSRVLRKNCVISAVGHNSLHKKWLVNGDNRSFDLHLIVYDDSYGRFYNDADFLFFRKGYKLKLVYDYLMQHPEYLEHYSYFFIPDDDIDTDAFQIERLFRAMEIYSLQIAQPSLRQSYYSFSHTLNVHFSIMRYTNFVEMMLPCFSKDALHKVVETFNANESGWGIEYHWASLINSNEQDMAIIDDITMVHTRPVQTGRSQNIIEMQQYMSKYNLSNTVKETGYLWNNTKATCQTRLIELYNMRTHVLNSLKELVQILIRIVNNGGISRPGLNGISNVALLLHEFSIISENIEYANTAKDIFERINMTNDCQLTQQSFLSGKLGYLWTAKKLSIDTKSFNLFVYNREKNCVTMDNDINTNMLGIEWEEIDTISVPDIMCLITKYLLKSENVDINHLINRTWKLFRELYNIEQQRDI